MTSHQAKQVLGLYRPGIDPSDEPEIAQALQFARRDPELARWFEERVALWRTIRAKLKQIEVPAGLPEKLRSPHAVAVHSWRRPLLLAAAAGIVLWLGLTSLTFLRGRQEQNLFAVYRSRMVRTAMQNYQMQFLTNDLQQIREFLARNNAHPDYVLSPPLERMAGDGCAILRWHNRKVSLICFLLTAEQDLYLFIINRTDLADPPTDRSEFAQVGRLATVSWSEGDKTYLLAGHGDEAFIRKFR